MSLKWWTQGVAVRWHAPIPQPAFGGPCGGEAPAVDSRSTVSSPTCLLAPSSRSARPATHGPAAHERRLLVAVDEPVVKG